jgi:hypothetical protein
VCPKFCATVGDVNDVAAARADLPLEEQERTFLDACPANRSSIVVRIWYHSPS